MRIVIDVEYFSKIKERMQKCIDKSRDGIILDSKDGYFVPIDSNNAISIRKTEECTE